MRISQSTLTTVYEYNHYPRNTLLCRRANLPARSSGSALHFAAIKVALHIITNIMAQHAGYGIFRDEMYYLICGQRLAFGYVDQPPMVALVARVTETLFGHDHMWSLRLFPALAGGAKVFLTGMMVWALGGGRRAAALAMVGVLVAGEYLGVDSFLSMNCFDPVFWMTCALALIMIVQAERPESVRNWWIVLGVSAGLGLENKVSDVFFLVCVLAALLLTPQRRILKSKWFGVAVLLMVVLALPNLLWQIHYHFPTLEWLRDVQHSDKDVKLGPLKFLVAQVVMLNPFTVLAMAERSGVAACEQSGAAISLPGRDVPAVCPADDGDAREGLLPGACVSGILRGGRSGAVLMGARERMEECADWRVRVDPCGQWLPLPSLFDSGVAAEGISSLREEDRIHATGYRESRRDDSAAVLCGPVWMERPGGAGERDLSRAASG